MEVPALPEEMEMLKKEFDELKAMQDDTGKMGFPFSFFWSFRWSESIRHICTAKENLLTDDKDASLFVCNSYMGDSFGADTWYKLSPTGGITKLRLHPFDSKQDKAEFQ